MAESHRENRMKKIINGEISKHIIIAGVPRSGKTTVCSLLANSKKYQHLCMDAIIKGFEDNFIETGVTTYVENPDTMVCDMSKKIAPFVNSIIEANNYDKLNYKLAIDLLEITPEDFVNFIDNKYVDIYFFGTPNLTPKENFERIRKYDTEDEYTYYLSNEELLKRCERFIDISKFLEKECKKYNLPFIDTSYNREEKIDEVVNCILEKIKK